MSLSEPPCLRVASDVKLGKNVRLVGFANLYGCEIGDDVKIGTFVEIQKGAKIGNRCKISSHTFICEGVTLEDEVFVVTTSRSPTTVIPAPPPMEKLQTEADCLASPPWSNAAHPSVPARCCSAASPLAKTP